MAIKSSDEVIIPKSTGAVKMPTSPVEHGQKDAADPKSTGAVKYVAPGETTVDHYDQDVVINEATPTDPVVFTTGWLSDAEAKVVTAKDSKDAPSKSDKAETK